jgi:ferrochelatase
LARPVIDQLMDWAAAEVDPGESALLYVAHSLPESFIKKGDPYLVRTQATVDAVHKMVTEALSEAGHRDWLDRLTGGAAPRLCFQSKVGPIAWLGPQIDEEVPRIAADGTRRLFVQPVSFTCEHIETLLELDIELKDEATAAGITDFARGAALNMNEVWLDSLAGHLIDDAFSPEVG